MLDSLGNLLYSPPQQPQVDGQPDLTNQWKSWLDQPANKAALLGFGIQALAGGYGSAGQQLAAALGNGIASGAGYDKLQRENEQQMWERSVKEQQIANESGRREDERNIRRETLTQQASEGALNRASHEKIAGIYANSRENIAAGKQDLKPLIQQEYMKAYNTTLQKLSDPISRQLAGLKSDEEVHILAKKAGDAAAAAFEAQFGAKGSAGTSVNSPNGSGSGSGAGSPVSQISPSNSVASATPPAQKPTLAQLLANPQWKDKVTAAMNNPAARELLKSKIADPQSLEAPSSNEGLAITGMPE